MSTVNYIWIGASSLAEKLYNKWVSILNCFEPNYILDNSLEKQGTIFLGREVDLVDNIKNYLTQDSVIIITSSYVDEIIAQLEIMAVHVKIMSYMQVNDAIRHNILYKNECLKSKCKSGRCFIVGTGPSLSEIDMDLLVGEDVIVVNHAYKSQAILNLQPLFWVVADPLFWSEQQKYLVPILNALSGRLLKTSLLIRADALYALKAEHYSNEQIFMYDMVDNHDSGGHLLSIDFTALLQNYAQNVLCPALLLSMFVGYKEIFLIGFDHSWWAYDEADVSHGRPIPHAYVNDSVDNMIAKNCYEQLGYSGLRKTIEIQKKQYAAIRKYAEQNEISIFNATIGGELDTFERTNFLDIFGRLT